MISLQKPNIAMEAITHTYWWFVELKDADFQFATFLVIPRG